MTDKKNLPDVDPAETQDWLESIDSVLRVHGKERAHFLIERLIDHARRNGAYLPYTPNTLVVVPKSDASFVGFEALESDGASRDILRFDLTLPTKLIH